MYNYASFTLSKAFLVVKYHPLPNYPQTLVLPGFEPVFAYPSQVCLQVVKMPLTRPRAGRHLKYLQTRTTSSINAINAAVNAAVTNPAYRPF